MRNPSYLIRSRHQIFYFRWPLPRQIRVRGKTNHVKISLQTRDPRYALRLATLLQNHVYNLLKHDWVLDMKYGEIKSMVETSLADILAKHKAMIDRSGPMPDFVRQRCVNAAQMLDLQIEGKVEADYEDDSEIADIVREYELDLSNSEEDRKNLKRLFLLGSRALMQQLLAYNDSQAEFDFSSNKARALASPENRLEQVIEKFMAEMAKSEAWGIRLHRRRSRGISIRSLNSSGMA